MIKSAPVKTSSASPAQFIQEARAELKKVVWPTKKQVINMTAIVIGVSVLVGAFIGGLDYLFTNLMALIIK